jgi:hypothetical protein
VHKNIQGSYGSSAFLEELKQKQVSSLLTPTTDVTVLLMSHYFMGTFHAEYVISIISINN